MTGGTAENAFKLLKRLCSLNRHVASTVLGSLAKESVERSSDVCVVLDVPPEKVGQAEE